MNEPIDTFRDSFLRFIAEGMSYSEALAEFDLQAFQKAMLAEGELRPGCGRDEESLLSLLACAGREERDARDMEKAIELWSHGWTSELPESYTTKEAIEAAKTDMWRRCAVMSFYWRRPPRTKSRKGKRFLSTDQAYNALRKEKR